MRPRGAFRVGGRAAAARTPGRRSAAAHTVDRFHSGARGGRGGPGRGRRARGSSPTGGWRGSRCGRSSLICGRLRRRQPGRPGSPSRSTRVGNPVLALLVGLVPGGPLVRVPVVRPADPPGLLRVAGPRPVAVPGAGRGGRDAAGGHVGAADHRAPVDTPGIGATSWWGRPRRRHGKQQGRPAGRPSGRPGDLSPASGRNDCMTARACLLQLRTSPTRRWKPSLIGVLGRRGARRPPGTFAEALRAVPPSGAGPRAAAASRPQVVPRRGRSRRCGPYSVTTAT